MTPQLVWLDLCAGLGGASQPALDRGWKVIRVDIDPRFKPDIVADVRALPLRPFHVDVLWASPPCQEFSKHGLRCFYPNPPEPDLSIAEAVKAEIERLAPRFWVIENVWASRPWLTKIFGQVRARPPGHALWSNLMFLLPNIEPHKGSAGLTAPRWGDMAGNRRGYHGRHLGGRWTPEKARAWFDKHGRSYVGTGHNGTEASRAAVIPYEIGEAICRAVEQQQEAVA